MFTAGAGGFLGADAGVGVAATAGRWLDHFGRVGKRFVGALEGAGRPVESLEVRRTGAMQFEEGILRIRCVECVGNVVVVRQTN